MAAQKKRSNPIFDMHWHLAQSDEELRITELEFAILRISAAFDRWQKDCLSCCVDGGLSGIDNTVLHIIRMHDRPKSISEVARLMNRDDISNLQYSLRKLTKVGLIARAATGDSKRTAAYEVTAEGTRVSDLFAQFRRELLLSLTDSIKDLDVDLVTASKVLNITSGLYDHASAVAASHRHK
ncbi:MAG: winged helix DNA-binding protein [Halieaceae bacterium]|nr:winged helix DNA-binding protein [Halieaceae bacterium]